DPLKKPRRAPRSIHKPTHTSLLRLPPGRSVSPSQGTWSAHTSLCGLSRSARLPASVSCDQRRDVYAIRETSSLQLLGSHRFRSLTSLQNFPTPRPWLDLWIGYSSKPPLTKVFSPRRSRRTRRSDKERAANFKRMFSSFVLFVLLCLKIFSI